MNLATLLWIGGALHFTILIASAMVPRVLDWRAHLAPLTPFLRRLFWVYGSFVVLTIAGFGALSLLNAEALAAGSPLARSLCGLVALFWLARLGVQFFVFDIRELKLTPLFKAGYHALTLFFVYFVAVYGAAAVLG